MGNEHPAFNPTNTPITTLTLTHLGPCSPLTFQAQPVLLKTYSYSDQFLLEDRHRRLKARLNKPTAHVLNLLQLHKQQSKELCANNYQILLYLEPPNLSLKQSIHERLASKRNYTEEQLYSFLGKVVDSLLYIQDNALKNIHLDSESILICGDNLKVLDTGIASSHTYLHLLQHLQKGQKTQEQVYLAPQLLKELATLNYDPYISPKADIFSLGMLLMEMVALEPMQGYYDYPRAAIDYDSLIHRLSRITHSLPLKTLIAEMLEYDPQERVGLVSLKQKIGKLKGTPETGMIRSRSSKMLQNILQHSRKSSRHSERNGSLSRQPSSQKKTHRIELRSGKKNESKLDSEPSVVPLSNCNQNLGNMPSEESNPHDLKNLVKNKLSRGGKEPKFLRSYRQALPQNNNVTKAMNIFQQSRGLQQSITSRKFNQSSRQNKQNKGVRATLNKLVQESGMNKLLRLEQLESGAHKYSQESQKDTSRFGSHEQNDSKELSRQGIKPQEIYIQEYKNQNNPSQKQGIFHSQDCRAPEGQKTLQKVMTFNKELLLHARSVDNSIESFSKVDKSTSKLALSPINFQHTVNVESEYKNITIKDVPVVISMQKGLPDSPPPSHFGNLQRKLNLQDYAQSIQKGYSINSSLHNTSHVIDGYKPHQQEQSPKQEYMRAETEMSAPFRKIRSKRPHLVLQLDWQDQPCQVEESSTLNFRATTSQDNYQTAQSIQYLSNFTTISPPRQQDELPSNTSLSSSPFSPSPPRRIQQKGGEQYEGQCKDGVPHGNGVLYREGKLRYSGSFSCGSFCGYGTLYNLDYCSRITNHLHIDLTQNYWIRFEGEFEGGHMSGFGTIFLAGGAKFSGCWKKGVIEGYGCFYGSSGQLTSGLWSLNRYRKV